jgi:hypothetical protein
MTSRERFLKTLDFQHVDVPWTRAYAGIWVETEAVWRCQGYEGAAVGWNDRELHERLDLDEIIQVAPWYGPVPPFEYKLIEEDELTRLYVNHEGILMREFKEHADTSMPQFVKFPVESAADFEPFAAERLQLNAAERLSDTWQARIAAGSDDHPKMCWADRWGGFFGSLRNMMGLENLCVAFYDQPALVERMMEERADAIIRITEEVMKHVSFDVFWFWEDMAYNHASLIDPKLYRKFALKHYTRVCDWLKSKGVKHIGLDSDGSIWELIPIWLDAGLTQLWPFEVQAGMDVVKVRKEYGHNLAILGGIDKHALVEGGNTMRQEVDRVMPLVEDGGYIPELDHGVPPDVSWQNFLEYVEYLKTRLGRG